ncbi:MAG: hemolysin family protein [bacterium]|nr:hemolysin family protein [bacterium]
MLLFFLAVGFSLLSSFLCSLAEATLLSVGSARIESLARSGSKAGQLLQRWKSEPDRPISAILVLNTIANSGGAAIATAQFEHAFPGISEIWFAAAFVIAVLTFTEIVPKTIGVVHSNRLCIPVAHFVRGTIILMQPALIMTRMLSRAIARSASAETTSIEEIRVLTAVGEKEGAFGSITASLIDGATRLRDTKARDVMVPRNRVSFVSGADSMEVNLERIRRSGHSRFPFTPTGEPDEVNGVILAKELLFSLRERDEPDSAEPDWDALRIPVIVVPASALLNHLLRRFQLEKRHLAIVVDEYGSTVGILTLEDVLEEIVGEIEDELDTAETQFLRRADRSLLCRGSAEARKIFQELELTDLETQSQTLAGFVTELHGGLPVAGTHVDAGGYRFLVTKANNRRVERVRITPAPAEAESADDD